ncbi:MAG: hypothetical protein GTO09_00165 [Candidatus Latescibacteria bacterium]|nr:hypothetical protein [Candidatus Latescibacterota bacterium]
MEEDSKMEAGEEAKQETSQSGPREIGLDMSSASSEAIDMMMDESADDAVFGEILSSNRTRTEVVRKLYEHARTPDDVRESAAQLLRVPVMARTQIEALRKRDSEARAKMAEKAKKESLVKRIQNMGMGEKVKLAQTGNKSIRNVLLADANKIVVLTALGNPKITEPEVEAVARNRSVVEDALREITKNKEWMKSYTIMSAVIHNPKTPPGISMKYVKFLKKKDLALLSKNKGVSDAVRNTALKLVKTQQR